MGDLHFWENLASAGLIDIPQMITNRSDFEDFISDVSQIDHTQKLFEQRPDTKWIFYQILSLTVFTYKILNGISILETNK